ncbi:unknown [Prevotella sp. CAG:924]|nr:unknown [Prevotella sp. CAG:924]
MATWPNIAHLSKHIDYQNITTHIRQSKKNQSHLFCKSRVSPSGIPDPIVTTHAILCSSAIIVCK